MGKHQSILSSHLKYLEDGTKIDCVISNWDHGVSEFMFRANVLQTLLKSYDIIPVISFFVRINLLSDVYLSVIFKAQI